MTRMRAAGLLAGWVALGVLNLAAQAPVESDRAALEKKLSDKVEASLKESGAPSVSVAVIEHGSLLFAKAFGKANVEGIRTADVNTRYAVGSVSKQFTVAAILLLQEQGKLSLDDKVAKYFPDLTRANDVTIRQLLSHTAGYEDFAPQDYIIPEWTRPTTPRAVIEQWARKPLNFDPGTKWQYSNTNYVLAGEIFEKASGQSLLAFLKEKIFQPLDMQSAGDCEIASPADATAYTRFALGPARPVAREAKGWYFAAGELCMTPSDLARWDMAFLQNKILTAASYREFLREVKLANGDFTHYALGLQLGELSGIPMVSHGGEVSGFLSENRVFPTRDAAVVALSNEDGVDLVGSLTRQMAAMILLPDRPAASEKETQQVRLILEELMRGKAERGLFTSNLNAYFTEGALRDYKNSLAPLGKLKSVSRSGEALRGGMTYRSYRAEFASKSVGISVYLTPDGKYEQFMVVGQ